MNNSDDDDTGAAAERKVRRDDLNSQAATVKDDIEAVEQMRIVDREVIAHLVAEGEANRDTIANLEVALVSARRIGAAMGILMVRYGVRENEAFEKLRSASQQSHRKLRDIADDVILVGALD